MGNKTRKDGAFKGERTRLAGRGEERKEGGKGKKGESAKASTSRTSAIPFVSVLPRPAFLAALSDALLRRPTTRLHRYKRDIQPRDLLFRTVSHNG